MIIFFGKFVTVECEHSKFIKWAYQIKSDILFVLEVKFKEYLVFLVVHQVTKWDPIFQFDELAFLFKNRYSELGLVQGVY